VRESQWYLLYVPLAFLLNTPLAALRGMGNLGLWNRLRFTLPAGYLLILLISPVLPGNRAAAVAIGYLCLSAVHGAIALWILVPRLPGARSVDRSIIRPLTHFGVLSFGADAPSWFNMRLDQLLMGAFVSPHLLGFYVIGVTWSGAVMPLSNALSQVIVPRLSRIIDPLEAAGEFARASRLAAAVTVGTGIGFALITPFAMRVVFGSAFAPAVPAALVLVAAAVFLGVNQFLKEGLRGLGRPGLAAIAEGIGLAVTVPGLFILLPRLGILGAALASLVAYATVFTFLSMVLSRYVGLSPVSMYLLQRADLRSLRRELGRKGGGL